MSDIKEINIVGKMEFGKEDIIIQTTEFSKEMTLIWNNSEKDVIITLKPGSKLKLHLIETKVTDGLSKENES